MDDFREWLSDNLRYFELGGAILLVVLLIIFGVRSCTKGKSSGSAETVASDTAGQTETVDEGDTDEAETNPLVPADPEIDTVIRSYYTALSNKDAVAARDVVTELSPTDEPLITNSSLENYQVNEVYTKDGLEDDTAFVYVTYTYQCPGIDTPVPAASSLYVRKDADGAWKIDTSATTDPEITSFMSSEMSDPQVQELTSKVKAAYDAALASSPQLNAYLNGMGEAVSADEPAQTAPAETNGPKVRAIDDVNVRDMAGGDYSEVIGQLSYGEEAPMLGREEDWIKISYNGGDGYVYSDYVEVIGEGSSDSSSDEDSYDE